MNRLSRRIILFARTQQRPRYLRMVATIMVHGRQAVPGSTCCPCCGSEDAEVVEEIAAADIVIDTFTGDRIVEADCEPARWRGLCADAEHHDIPLRCSERALPLLLDESGRHIFASGGNRATKTTTGLVWLALMWLRHGGRERQLWLVAPTDKMAHRLLEKLFKGTGESPPILPSTLIVRSPSTYRASNLQTRLVDGSVVDLRSYHGDPGAERAKSDAIVAALVDEAAHLPSPDWLAALRGRCVDAGGRLWLASTPRPSSFLKYKVVDQALAFEKLPADDPKRLAGDHEGAAWIFLALPMAANPWLPLVNIERDMRTLDMSAAENRRDFGGEWAASEGRCWPDFDLERHRIAHEARDVQLLSPTILAGAGAAGHVPITAECVRRLFGRTNPHYRPVRASNTRYILGQDVNVSPMQSVIVQVTAPADAKGDREKWHVWVIDGVTSPHSNSLEHARRLVSAELARTLDPLGSGSPLAGCGVVIDATSLGKVDPHADRHGQRGSIAETFGRLGLDVRAPMYRRSKMGQLSHVNGERRAYFELIHRMLAEGRIHVFSRSGALLHAFDVQIVEPDGTCPIDSRRGMWDQVMGPMDAFRYVLYAIMNSSEAQPAQVDVLR